MSDSVIKLIQITDCHLGEVEGTELLSMNPDESLADVLNLINENHSSADLLIATGDLANDPASGAYQRLHNVLSENIKCPFLWLPGNHDDPALMAEFGEDVNTKYQVIDDWIIIMLNSRVEQRIYGNFSSEELELLETVLSEHSDKSALVCMHHQPVPIGSQWMDNYIVRNADEFWSIIDRFINVKIVLWGHVHQEFTDKHNNITLLSTPSTCVQFTPNKEHFDLEDVMPAYRWLELNSDGSFTTGVERVATKDYGIDFETEGY